jgi:hypothetical protein
MPAPTPFTMEDVVNDVLLELRYAPGRDVQIHLQSSIMHDASVLYRTLMQKYVWRDFYHVAYFTTDNATGEPVEDLSAYLRKYSDVRAVYKDSDDAPLQFAPALVNPKALKQPTVVKSSTPKIFAVMPAHTYNCTLVSQTAADADFDLDDVVPFYRDLLSIGTAYLLALKAGTNVDLTGQLKTQFEQLVQTYRLDEIKPQYHARPTNIPNVMTDWWSPA